MPQFDMPLFSELEIMKLMPPGDINSKSPTPVPGVAKFHQPQIVPQMVEAQTLAYITITWHSEVYLFSPSHRGFALGAPVSSPVLGHNKIKLYTME